MESAEETTYFVNQVAVDRAYMGINDHVNEGSWVWDSTGQPIIYTNWQIGEPNGDNTINCAEIYLDGTWNDISCDELKLALCVICADGQESCLPLSGTSTHHNNPAMINGPSGLVGLPSNGEILLYHEFIDTSTGAQSFHRYMNLGFVEAEEDFRRVALVS